MPLQETVHVSRGSCDFVSLGLVCYMKGDYYSLVYCGYLEGIQEKLVLFIFTLFTLKTFTLITLNLFTLNKFPQYLSGVNK